MKEDARWDPQMLALLRSTGADAPMLPIPMPFDDARRQRDALQLPAARGGPAMAESVDRWVLAQGRRVQCRLHRPRADTALPALVYFHGGGWVYSSVDTHDRLVRELAGAAGCAAISVDYALAPEARFPQALEECAGVVRQIAAEGGSWGLDPSRLVLGGDSAGGNLAFATALRLRDAPSLGEPPGPALSGILALYPVCSASGDSPTWREFADGYGLRAADMRGFWELYAPDPADRLSPLASPLLARLDGLPPCLLLLAELDILRGEGEAMAARLREHGVAAELDVARGLAHGFARTAPFVDASGAALARAGAWLKRSLAAT